MIASITARPLASMSSGLKETLPQARGGCGLVELESTRPACIPDRPGGVVGDGAVLGFGIRPRVRARGPACGLRHGSGVATATSKSAAFGDFFDQVSKPTNSARRPWRRRRRRLAKTKTRTFLPEPAERDGAAHHLVALFGSTPA